MSAMANSPAIPGAHGPVAGHTARVGWTLVGLVLAITAVTLWVGTQIRTEFQNSYAIIPVHQRVYPDPVHRLIVQVDSGSVSIERGSGSTTIVDTTGTRSTQRPTDDEHLIGSTLYLRSNCGQFRGFPNYCSRDYRVRVPGDVSVTVTVTTGNLFVNGMHGSVKAALDTGSISVNDEVGSLNVSTQSGTVIIRHEDGVVDASTETGDMLLSDARGPATLESVNGNVVISGASTSVHVTSQTGSVAATALTGSTFSATVANGSVGLSFTTAPHEVDASAQTGSVTIRVPYGDVRYQLHLKSGTGRVVSAIPNDASSTRVIRAITANGDVILGVGVVPTTPGTPQKPATPSPPTTALGG